MTWRWVVHNTVAHPLLVLCPPVGEWLHDRTIPTDAGREPAALAPGGVELGWHVIAGAHLLNVMRRSATEDPDLVYAELWANAKRPPS